MGLRRSGRRRGRLLREQMEAAIAGEQYERAARLRDELRRLTETGLATDADANGDPP
ncbi:MAG: UvrB/UvrC motif-containing protein [Phycisphaeraceae bacterium]|nr:UvrB/UvrC motif-containing protein [Phycisphaeraceae bacterium]